MTPENIKPLQSNDPITSTAIDFNQYFPKYLIRNNTAFGVLKLDAYAPYKLEIETVALRASTLVDIVTFTRTMNVGSDDSTRANQVTVGKNYKASKMKKDYSWIAMLPQQVDLKALDTIIFTGTVGGSVIPEFNYNARIRYDRSYFSELTFQINRSIIYIDKQKFNEAWDPGDLRFQVWQNVTQELQDNLLYKSRFKVKVDALLYASMSDFDHWLASLLFYNNLTPMPYTTQFSIDTDALSITPFRRYCPEKVSFEESLTPYYNALNNSLKVTDLKSALNSCLRNLGTSYPTGYMETLDGNDINKSIERFEGFFKNLNISNYNIVLGRELAQLGGVKYIPDNWIVSDVLDGNPSIVTASQNTFGIPFLLQRIAYGIDPVDKKPIVTLTLQVSTRDLASNGLVMSSLGQPIANLSGTGRWFLGDQLNTASLKYWLDKKFDIALNVPARIANKINYSPLNPTNTDTGHVTVNINPKYTVSGTFTAQNNTVMIVADARQFAVAGSVMFNPDGVTNTEFKYEPNIDMYITAQLINTGEFKARSASLPQLDYLATLGTIGTAAAPVPLSYYLINPSYRPVFAITSDAIVAMQQTTSPVQSDPELLKLFKDLYMEATEIDANNDNAIHLLQSTYEKECAQMFGTSSDEIIQSLIRNHQASSSSLGSPVKSWGWNQVSNDEQTKELFVEQVDVKQLLENNDGYKTLLPETTSLINITKQDTLNSYLGLYITHRSNLPEDMYIANDQTADNKDVIIGVNANFNASVNLNLGATMKLFTGKVTNLPNTVANTWTDENDVSFVTLHFLDFYDQNKKLDYNFINTGWRVSEFLITGLIKVQQLKNIISNQEYGPEIIKLLYASIKANKTHLDKDYTIDQCKDMIERYGAEIIHEDRNEGGVIITIQEEGKNALIQYFERHDILNEFYLFLKNMVDSGRFNPEKSITQNLDVIQVIKSTYIQLSKGSACVDEDFYKAIRLVISENTMLRYKEYFEIK